MIEASEQHGPFDLIFEATGHSPLAFEAAEALGKNGVLILSSVTSGDKQHLIPTDRINHGFVLGNKVMVGTVNASRADFLAGVDDLLKAETLYPGWLAKTPDAPRPRPRTLQRDDAPPHRNQRRHQSLRRSVGLSF